VAKHKRTSTECFIDHLKAGQQYVAFPVGRSKSTEWAAPVFINGKRTHYLRSMAMAYPSKLRRLVGAQDANKIDAYLGDGEFYRALAVAGRIGKEFEAKHGRRPNNVAELHAWLPKSKAARKLAEVMYG
jgi:hypothetical protein